MKIEENKSLKNYNTFGIDAKAKLFASVTTIDSLKNILKTNTETDIFVLGGGSNLLLTKDINALVLHINLKGIKIIEETDEAVIVEAMAGENWHEFVLHCIENDYGGIENLSLIPGNVGTAPIQNIGAYGVELKDVFESCKAISINNQTTKTFRKEDCNFGYRNSIFKNETKGKYVIISVRFRLTKNKHLLKTSYGAIAKKLEENHIVNPTIKDVSEAVIAIRNSKLPNPEEIGNSGSFFKNPIISGKEFNRFIAKNPTVPFYKLPENTYKIPAGWLIEKAGFKGKRFGDTGVHKNQALVLVNYGNATGNEIWELAKTIQKTVQSKFDIFLEPEVNVI